MKTERKNFIKSINNMYSSLTKNSHICLMSFKDLANSINITKSDVIDISEGEHTFHIEGKNNYIIAYNEDVQKKDLIFHIIREYAIYKEIQKRRLN